MVGGVRDLRHAVVDRVQADGRGPGGGGADRRDDHPRRPAAGDDEAAGRLELVPAEVAGVAAAGDPRATRCQRARPGARARHASWSASTRRLVRPLLEAPRRPPRPALPPGRSPGSGGRPGAAAASGTPPAARRRRRAATPPGCARRRSPAASPPASDRGAISATRVAPEAQRIAAPGRSARRSVPSYARRPASAAQPPRKRSRRERSSSGTDGARVDVGAEVAEAVARAQAEAGRSGRACRGRRPRAPGSRRAPARQRVATLVLRRYWSRSPATPLPRSVAASRIRKRGPRPVSLA